MTVARLLLRSSQMWGEKPALIDPVRGRSISFSELVAAAFFLGNTLRRRGLVAGDRVAILGDGTPDYLCADYGIMSAGLVRVPLDPAWEHALVAVQGEASAESVTLDTAHLLYLGTRREGVEITSPTGATLFLLGGEPFEDDVVMWWNFVGRTHEEIVDAREAWESGSERFGRVVDHGDERIPAPPMPAVRLTRRRRRL